MTERGGMEVRTSLVVEEVVVGEMKVRVSVDWFWVVTVWVVIVEATGTL